MPSHNGNPPDKFAIVYLTGTSQTDTDAINAFADQGYIKVVAFTEKYVLLGGYKGN